MQKDKTDKMFVLIVMLVFYGFSVLCLLKPAEDISYAERRKLARFPELSLEDIMSGKFMDRFEKYAADQLPFRQTFKGLKSAYEMYIEGKKDIDGLYINDGYIVKQEYPLNEESVFHAAERFGYIYDRYLKECDVYLSIIPDKNYFADPDEHLKADYEKMVRIMCNSMEYAQYIDIFGELELRDYYITDPHWRQESIAPVANTLLKGMGNDEYWDFTKVYIDTTFYGAYYGQLALSWAGDRLAYVSNPYIQYAKAYDYENDREIWVYDLDAAEGTDPYEMYMYGSLSLVSISNPIPENGKELIIFRDSFASSIAPMLLSEYDRIILVDIRYISIDVLEKYIDFKDKDVLFLYSTTVLNNSEVIK